MNELQLYKDGEVKLTNKGDLYIEHIQGSLHRITEYQCELIDGSVMQFSWKEYQLLLRVMQGTTTARFLKLQDGTILAVNQIRRVKPVTKIIDTNKDY